MRFCIFTICIFVFNSFALHAADEAAELRKKLYTVKVNVDAENKPFEEVLAATCEQARIKLTIDPTPLEKGRILPTVCFYASQIELNTALHWIAASGGMDFTVTRNGIFAARDAALYKNNLITKTYELRDLTKYTGSMVAPPGGGIGEIQTIASYVELLRSYSTIDNFYGDFGTKIEYGPMQKDTTQDLIVTNLPERHDEVATFLAAARESLRLPLGVSISTERLDREVWQADLRKKLQTKITLKIDAKPMPQAAIAIARAAKVPLFHMQWPNKTDIPTVTQDFKDVTAEQALKAILPPNKWRWVLSHQVVLLEDTGSQPFRAETRIYNVSRLREPVDTIEENMRKKVKPDSWDFGRIMSSSNHKIMFIQQTPEVHDLVKAYLKTLPTKN
jgi:hypothetical protein